MYNRYVPQPDGSYRRDRMHAQPRSDPQQPQHTPPQQPYCPPEQPEQRPYCPPEQPEQRPLPPPSCQGGSAAGFLQQLLPRDLDTGDLLIIILLLLMAGDCKEDRNTALLTLALYLFL